MIRLRLLFCCLDIFLLFADDGSFPIAGEIAYRFFLPAATCHAATPDADATMEYDTEMQPPPAEEGAAASRDDDNEAFTTRPYQEQMIELALKRNTIIFLPTGAGKTYIALQTIKRMSKVLEK